MIDGENRLVANRPGDALNWGWFERCKIAMRDATIIRDSIKMYDKTHRDYYAVLEEKGLRIHLVAFMTSDKRFAESTCKMIKQNYPNEPLIVYNHFSDWSVRFLSNNSPILKADIIMGADTHAYKLYDVSGDALAFNTCIHAPPGHVFDIRVFKECFVLLALQSGKCLMGRMDVHE